MSEVKGMKAQFTFVDRYSATGTPRPGKNACKTCEGMGYHPTNCDCRGTKPQHTMDTVLQNWCMVDPCQSCKGTRTR